MYIEIYHFWIFQNIHENIRFLNTKCIQLQRSKMAIINCFFLFSLRNVPHIYNHYLGNNIMTVENNMETWTKVVMFISIDKKKKSVQMPQFCKLFVAHIFHIDCISVWLNFSFTSLTEYKITIHPKLKLNVLKLTPLKTECGTNETKTCQTDVQELSVHGLFFFWLYFNFLSQINHHKNEKILWKYLCAAINRI